MRLRTDPLSALGNQLTFTGQIDKVPLWETDE